MAALATALWLTRQGDAQSDAADQALEQIGQVAQTGSQTVVPPVRPEPRTPPQAANVAPPAGSQVVPHRPLAVELPSGRQVPIDESATGADGTLGIPSNVDRAGWWDGSSRLGDPFGSIVVAAHIDSFTQGLGRFVELLDMHPGDVVTLRSASSSQRFRVTSADLVPKSRVTERSAIYSVAGDTRLVLLTCGGDYNPSSGYADNMVVVATPSGRLQPLAR